MTLLKQCTDWVTASKKITSQDFSHLHHSHQFTHALENGSFFRSQLQLVEAQKDNIVQTRGRNRLHCQKFRRISRRDFIFIAETSEKAVFRLSLSFFFSLKIFVALASFGFCFFILLS